jgi:hypothetical protein
MASDSAATYAAGGMHTIGQQPATKLRKLGNSILYSSTGAVGMSQMIAEGIETRWASDIHKKAVSPVQVMEILSRDISDRCQHLFRSAAMLGQAGMRHAQLDVSCRSLIAMPVLDQACMFQFAETGAPEQATKDLCCVALGSGQPIADPFLALMKRILWSDHQPTLAEARLVAAWTIQHVVQTNPGGVGGDLQMATLVVKGNQTKIEMLDAAEHYERIGEEEASLRDHILRREVAPAPPPDVPLPESGAPASEIDPAKVE